ncbi:hypothetical protein ZWY2020_021032, partial [Hordeum vulgare]
SKRKWLCSTATVSISLCLRTKNLEPGFVGELRIEGDIKLLSVLASGLATREDFEHVTDLEILKAPHIP